MTRRMQYPAKVGPVQVGDPITLDRWFCELSRPMLPKAALAIAVAVTAGLTAPSFVPPPSFGWFAPLSKQPVQPPTLTGGARTQTVGPLLIPPPNFGWFAPLSQPRIPSPALSGAARSQVVGPVAPVISSEVVTVDKWFRPLAEPVRLPAMRAAGSPAASVGPTFVPAPSFGWFAPLSQALFPAPALPSSLRPYFTVDPLALTRPEVTTPDKWFKALSEPVRPAPWLASAAQVSTVSPVLPPSAAEVITVDKWFRALSEPARLPSTRTPGSPDGSVAPSFVPLPSIDWFAPLAGPAPRAAAPFVAAQTFTSPVLPPSAAEIVTVDKWFRALSEPLRLPPVRTLASPQAAWVPTFVPPPAMDWHVALSTPVVRPAARLLSDAWFGPATLVSSVEVVTVDKWFRAWSEPVRVMPSRQPDASVAPAFVPAPSFGWFVALSQPVQPPLPVQKQSFFGLLRSLVVEVVTLDKWFRPLSEPVRRPPWLGVNWPSTAQQLLSIVIPPWSLVQKPRMTGTSAQATMVGTEIQPTLNGTQIAANLKVEVDQ